MEKKCKGGCRNQGFGILLGADGQIHVRACPFCHKFETDEQAMAACLEDDASAARYRAALLRNLKRNEIWSTLRETAEKDGGMAAIPKFQEFEEANDKLRERIDAMPDLRRRGKLLRDFPEGAKGTGCVVIKTLTGYWLECDETGELASGLGDSGAVVGRDFAFTIISRDDAAL